MRTDTNRQWTTYRILDRTIDNPDLADPLNLGESGTGKGFILWADTADYRVDWDEAGDGGKGILSFGQDTKGIDVKFFGATTGHYLLWDQSGDSLELLGANTRIVVGSTVDAADTDSGSIQTDGGLGVVKKSFFGDDMRMVDDAKVEFRDATTYIYAAGAGGLTVYGGTEILLTTPVTRTTGTLSVAGQAMGSGITLIAGTLEVAAGGLTVSGGATITGTIAGLGGITAAGGCTITGTIAGLGGLTIAGAASITGVITGSSHIVVSQGSYIFMDGISGGEYIRSDTADDLMINATANIKLAIGGSDIWTFASWGSVLEAGHLYLASDFSGYIGMVDGVMHIGGAQATVEFRVGGKTALTISAAGPETSYIMRVLGAIDFGAKHTGTLFLPQRADPVTQPSEGTLWYNFTTKKLQFANSATTMETVTSS